jgi:NAD(P)-dependent dehydrogenase (short-subunit alcohol dehydrogenase family)
MSSRLGSRGIRAALLCAAVTVASGGPSAVGAGLSVTQAAAAAATPASPSTTTVPTVLVTGANRGIGLALAKIYAARGWQVIATARKPADAVDLRALAAADADVSVEALEVTDHAQVDALAQRLKDRRIDVLINNAGITGDRAAQVFGRLDYAAGRQVFETNTLAPMKIAESFMPHLLAGRQRKLVTISSSEGSVTGVNSARTYWYRASKAAVNMLMRNLAFAVQKDGVSVALVNPGPVATDMMKGARIPLQPVDEAAGKVVGIVDALTLEKTGRLWDYAGGELPW